MGGAGAHRAPHGWHLHNHCGGRPFSWLLTRLGALQGLENWLVGFEHNIVLFMLIFLSIILVAGMLADIVANLIILGPTLLAAAEKVGLSDTQASMVICVGFLLGTVTPPVGICYFAASRIAEEQLERVAVNLLPFIGTASAANYGGFHKTFEVMALPYIFKDDASAQKVLDDYLFETLDKISTEHDKMKVLAVVPFLGFRQLETNVGEIRTPKDLKGTKIRVTKSPLDGALLRSWGAVTTPVAWAETYDAVQQKVVRGLYVQKSVHAMMKFHEVAPYVTLTGGAWTPMLVFMDLKKFNSLPKWGQEALDKAAADLRSKVFEIDARYAAKMGAENVGKVNYYSPEDAELDEWRNASARAWLVGKKLKLYEVDQALKILNSQSGLESFVEQLKKVRAL